MLDWLKGLFGLRKTQEPEAPIVLESPTKEQLEEMMKQVMDRPQYKVLTIEIIDSLKDNELVQTISDTLSLQLDEDFEKEVEWLNTLNQYQRAIYYIWWLEAEVNNGGFNQFYHNSSGRFSSETPAALELVGASEFAKLVTEANQLFETHGQDITQTWDGTIEGFKQSYNNNPLDELDTRFYKLYEQEKLTQLQIAFIRANKEQFIR